MKSAGAVRGAVNLASLAAVLSCGGGGTEPSGPAGLAGTWVVTFSQQRAGSAACESPSMILSLSQTGTALAGSYAADGLGICIMGPSILVGDMAFGSIASGSADHGSVTVVLRSALQFNGTFEGDSMSGSLSWMVILPDQGPVEMTGTWNARRLPASSANGDPYRMTFTETANAVPQVTSTTFPVVVRDRGGNLVSSPALSFTTSDPAVATVSGTGVVTTTAKLGLFRIRAQAGVARAEGVGVVIQRPVSFLISPSPLTMNRSRSLQVGAQALDVVGAVIPGAPLTYAIGDITIAQVTPSGVVTSRTLVGQTTLTIGWAGVDTVVPLTVIALPVHVELDLLAAAVTPGGTQSLVATVYDSSDVPIAGAPVTWTSSNPGIASVSPAGLVTAGQSGGVATITATAENGDTAQARILNWTAAIPGVVATTRIGGRPSGLDVAANGAIYVGDAQGGGLWRGDLPAVDFPVNLPLGGSFPAVAFNPAGTRAYAQTSGAGNVVVIDVATGTVVDSLVPGNGAAIGVSADGARLIVGQGASLQAYDATTLSPLGSVTFGTVEFLARHPLQDRLYASTSAGVFELDGTTLATLRMIVSGPGPYRQIAITPDGASLFVGREGTGVYAYDLATGQQTGFAAQGGFGVGYSAARDLIYTTASQSGTMSALDRASLIPIWSTSLGGVARRIAVSADGLTVIVLDEDGDVNFVQ